MFKELAPILEKAQVQIFLSQSQNGLVKAVVVPQPKDNTDGALSTPLCLEATVEELDEKLPAVLSEFVSLRRGVEDSLEAAKAIMEAAQKEAQDKASKAGKKSAAKPSTTQEKSSNSEMDKNSEGSSEAEPGSGKKQPETADINLFG